MIIFAIRLVSDATRLVSDATRLLKKKEGFSQCPSGGKGGKGRLKAHLHLFEDSPALLSYLAQFPVSIMKIDKSFIHNVQQGTKKEIILKSMIDFGKNLGIIVLCEGIETKHQHTLMTGFGCQQMQGFLYSRGIHIDEILPAYPI